MTTSSTAAQQDSVIVQCRACHCDVPSGAFCGYCGTHLYQLPGSGPDRLRADSYVAEPNEQLLRLSLISSLFPHLLPRSRTAFRVALGLLTVLLVVGAGYAVWSYLPRQQTIVAEKVPPVPDRLLASSPSTSETAARRAEAAPVVTATSKTDRTGKAEATIPAAPVQQAQDMQAVPSPRQEAVVAPPPAVIAVPAAPPPVMMSAPSAGQALAAQPPAIDTQRPAPVAADPQEAVARPAPPASTDSAMVVATPTKSDTQVIVRSNSWVELRSPNGDVLTQTYVRAGESYVVPAGIAYRIIQAH